MIPLCVCVQLDRDETTSTPSLIHYHTTPHLTPTRQFPQTSLSPTTTPAQRKNTATIFAHALSAGSIDTTRARLVASFDPVVHVFTHIRLTMHAYHFRIDADVADEETLCSGLPARKWVDAGDMHGETLSTGMRRCWELVA